MQGGADSLHHPKLQLLPQYCCCQLLMTLAYFPMHCWSQEEKILVLQSPKHQCWLVVTSQLIPNLHYPCIGGQSHVNNTQVCHS